MSITILGYHISIIRKKRIYQHIKIKQLWANPEPSEPKTKKLTRREKREIANQMGYTLMEA